MVYCQELENRAGKKMALILNRFSIGIAQIKRANKECRTLCTIPYSNFNGRILLILKAYGFIRNFTIRDDDYIDVHLSRQTIQGSHVMTGLHANVRGYNRYYAKYTDLRLLSMENPNCTIVISTIYGLTTFDQLQYHKLCIGGKVCLIVSSG